MKPVISDEKRDRLYDCHRSIEDAVDTVHSRFEEMDITTEGYDSINELFNDVYFKLKDLYEEIYFS